MNMNPERGQIINHIPEDNFLFSVLGTENDCFYEAIMEHFFEIRFLYKEWGNFIDFDFEDNLNWTSFKGVNVLYMAQNYLDYLSHQGELEKILIGMLDQRYQILTPVNMRYIGWYLCPRDQSHMLYILRYDKETDVLLCKDFFRWAYAEEWIPRKEVYEAICHYQDINFRDVRGQKDTTGLVALKKKEGYIYQFRPRVFIKRFSDMLHYGYDLDSPSYGLGIFDALAETLLNGTPYWRPSAGRRLFQFAVDNLELIKHRLAYLHKVNHAVSIDRYVGKCTELQEYCGKKRNQLLKYEIHHQNELIVKKDIDMKNLADSFFSLKGEMALLIEGIIKTSEDVFGAG